MKFEEFKKKLVQAGGCFEAFKEGYTPARPITEYIEGYEDWYDLIAGFASWEDTKQGHDYWIKIANFDFAESKESQAKEGGPLTIYQAQDEVAKLLQRVPGSPFLNCGVDSPNSVDIGGDSYAIDEAEKIYKWLGEVLGK